MTGLQAELEAAFRKLPIAPPDDGGIPYEWVIPGIGRQLALMRPVDRKVASPDATKRKLVALKKHAKILCEDMSGMALLPLKLRILIVEIAHAENPKLPPPAGRGAPQKSLAMQVARTVAEHFYGLTGTRPTRITPTGGGKAHGPFLEFLATHSGLPPQTVFSGSERTWARFSPQIMRGIMRAVGAINGRLIPV